MANVARVNRGCEKTNNMLQVDESLAQGSAAK
jgi:hypothetical protein